MNSVLQNRFLSFDGFDRAGSVEWNVNREILRSFQGSRRDFPGKGSILPCREKGVLGIRLLYFGGKGNQSGDVRHLVVVIPSQPSRDSRSVPDQSEASLATNAAFLSFLVQSVSAVYGGQQFRREGVGTELILLRIPVVSAIRGHLGAARTRPRN